MNVVIVEDSPLIRQELLFRMAVLQPRLQVVGTAAEENEAVELILGQQVDAVVLDLSLASGHGLSVLQRLRAAGHGARVLILTNSPDREMRATCLRAGANGFFDKSLEIDACLERLASWLPPLPATEERRLKQLQGLGLLDMRKTEIFDRITLLAAEITGMPVALLTLVEEHRQVFLSRTGTELHETSRSVSFCAHAILDDALMEVRDTQQDPRFVDNPLVVGPPHIRFYAGVPLVLSSGDALGTLCILDSQPRQLNDRQRRALRTLASGAMAEIELRRYVIELEQEAERRRHAESHILHLATRDALTALPNRTTFRDRLEQQILMGRRQQQKFGVLFLDLDRFKPINDSLGHDGGDEALVTVATRLVQTLRESDTVARLGGDEFGIVLPSLGGSDEAMTLAAKLVAALDEPVQIKGHAAYLGASIGVVMYPDHGTTGDQLLGHADRAMYQAKRHGGRQAVLYSAALSERDAETRGLLVELQDALQGDQLVLHYQPQLTLDTAQLCGMEALVRWNHPRRGLLAPVHFIELAETHGLVRELTRHVLDRALAQLAQWDRAGFHVPRMAVNVSALDIRSELVAVVADALQRHGLPPYRLELEITESTLTSDGIETQQVLGQLREMGVGIAVDDFGVGYSSLGQIHRLPIDCLKIDRSFVQEMTTSSVDVAIVTATLTMAKALSLRTVAEGVEDQAQLALLEQLGCGCVQGYLLSRPAPAQEIERWSERHRASLATTVNGQLLP